MRDVHSAEEVAHILGADIVSFSQKSIEAQVACVQIFHRLVSEALESSGVQPLLLDRGDGAMIVFSGSLFPALEVCVALASRSREEGLPLRIGLHTGPITKHSDVNGELTVFGPGINMAARAMNAAGSGGFVVTSFAAEIALAYDGWRDRLVSLGEVVVKHGERLDVYSIPGFDTLEPEAKPPDRNVAEIGHHNLPQFQSSTFGREFEKSQLRKLLEGERRRLVTIAGPGGIGKTCLAKMVGWQMEPDYPDGVWFVDCGRCTTTEEVEALMRAVVEPHSQTAAREDLRDWLKPKRCLMILDCLERIPSVVSLIHSWLNEAPGVQILATSRAILGSEWETEYFIGPLPTKRGEDGSIAAELLFIDAVRRFDPTFSVSRGTRPLIEAIVSSLEGVPVSIILAAGRLRYVSLSELRDTLGTRRLDVLRRRTGMEDKHADIRGIVADSFNLLEEGVRDVMIRLSVFDGGFYLSDAHAVLGSSPDLTEAIELLRDNSLLSPTVVGARMRYQALDVVTEYSESLAQDIELPRRTHACHFAEQAIRARKEFDGGNWGSESEQFWQDIGNYRRAIAYAIDCAEQDLVLGFARSLGRIFMEAGLRKEFEELALRAEAAPQAEEALRLELQGLLGGIYRREDNREKAETYWLRRAQALSNGSDFVAQADAWTDLECMALHYGDDAAAESYLDRFWEVAARLETGRATALGHVASGVLLLRQGETEAARKRSIEAEGGLEGAPLDSRTLFAFTYLASLCEDLGDHDRAIRLSCVAIPDAVGSKHLSYAGQLLVTLAAALLSAGKLQLSAKAIALADRIPKSISVVLNVRLKQIKKSVESAVIATLGDRAVEPPIANWAKEAVILAQEISAQLKETPRDERPNERTGADERQ